MLTFVGLGLFDERSITVEGQDAIRGADRAFAEVYTSRLTGTSLTELEEYHGIEIERRTRKGVETDPEPVLMAAMDEDVVFMTAGDPMVATTHVDLRLRAHERGIETRLIHGPSVQSAVCGLTGLQSYRFGRATTLPFPGSHGPTVPESVSDTIADNLSRGLHTVVYLDIDATEDRYLTASDAARALAERYGDTLAVAIARAGSPEPVVEADRLSTLASHDFGEPLHLLLIPGNLHDLEARALRSFAGAPEALLDPSLGDDWNETAERVARGRSAIGRSIRDGLDDPRDMGVPDRPTEWFDVARTRHRYLVGTGGGLAVAGGLLSTWIVYEWLVRGVSHEVLAVGAGFSILLGVQLLVLSTLTSLLVDLHERRTGRIES